MRLVADTARDSESLGFYRITRCPYRSDLALALEFSNDCTRATPLGWLCDPEPENAYFLRRTLKAMPAIPIPIRDSVLGSGAGAPGVVMA